MTATRIDTSRYQAAHGKAPRGYGHWTFARTLHRDGDLNFQRVRYIGTYSEARKVALAKPAPEGWTPVLTTWTVQA